MQQKEAPPGTRPAPGTFSALLQDIERLSVEAPAGGGVPPGAQRYCDGGLVRAARAARRGAVRSGKLEAAARLRDELPEPLEWYWAEIEPQFLDRLVNHPRVVIARAAALEGLGRRPEARKDLEALLGIWREADHDLPLYLLARSRLLEPMDSATSRDGPLDPFPRVGPEQRLRVARADATSQGTPESLAWLAAAEQVAGAGTRALGTAREALRLDDGTRIRSVDVACGVLEQQGAPGPAGRGTKSPGKSKLNHSAIRISKADSESRNVVQNASIVRK